MGTAERDRFIGLLSCMATARFYSLSRDGDSGTRSTQYRATWHRVSIRCREMGTAEPQQFTMQTSCIVCFYSLSREGDSGTHLVDLVEGDELLFYSLSRDGDSGTSPPASPVRRMCFYSLSRDGDSGTAGCRVLPTSVGLARVSIRCREMGTAERLAPALRGEALVFLFAVARWGQRNMAVLAMREDGAVSIRCREMGTAERVRLGGGLRPPVSIRCREMGTAEHPE